VTAGNSFSLIGEELRFRGRILEVVSATYEDPDGEPFEREVVRHPGAVAVVALREAAGEPEVVLVRQFRVALGRDSLELPAGLRDVDGEAPVDTARRELREESGYDAAELVELITVDTAPGFADEQIIVYLATDLRCVGRSADSIEEQLMTVETVPWSGLVDLVRTGALVDAKTLAGLWAAALRLNL
jgi:ADP-ribose pyrophosphatase